MVSGFQRTHAFSLIELLPALSVAALVWVTVFTLYYGVWRAWTARTLRDQAQAEPERALLQWADDVSTSFPVHGFSDGSMRLEKQRAFGMEFSRIQFTKARSIAAIAPGDRGGHESVLVSYQLDPAESGAVAFVRVEQPLTGPEALTAAVTNILARKVVSLEIQLYDGESWMEVWRAPERDPAEWPRAARVQLSVHAEPAVPRTYSLETIIPAGWTFAPEDP